MAFISGYPRCRRSRHAMMRIREGRHAEVRERAITPVFSKSMEKNDIGGIAVGV
jgi:hypothetical protein